jgi:uncharacterized protein
LVCSVDYEVLTWNQIYRLLFLQAQKISLQCYCPDVLVGVARGGLIPARILADLLETEEFVTIQTQHYTGIEQTLPAPTLKQPLNINITGKRILLVDDIADSGSSLKLAQTHLHTEGAATVKTATLYKKPHSKITPDFYEKQTSRWIVFPWETKETLRKILQRQEDKQAVKQEVAKLVKAGLPKLLVDRLLKDMT